MKSGLDSDLKIINLLKLSENSAVLTVEYLKYIHAEIFKDDPYYQAGELRLNSAPMRSRQINEGNYAVFYYQGKVSEKLIQQKLDEWEQSLTSDKIDNITRLYAILDHLHPFTDGNSRTIREFVRQIAEKQGIVIAWGKTATEQGKKELYMARDKEVLKLSYGHITKENVLDYDRDAIEAYQSLNKLKDIKTLKEIISSCSFEQTIELTLDKKSTTYKNKK